VPYLVRMVSLRVNESLGKQSVLRVRLNNLDLKKIYILMEDQLIKI